jgi:hypothetical protein
MTTDQIKIATAKMFQYKTSLDLHKATITAKANEFVLNITINGRAREFEATHIDGLFAQACIASMF